MKTKILLIGGAGYVGSLLTPALLAMGYEVIVYDLLIYGKEPLAAHLKHPHFTLIEGDVRDIDRFTYALDGCNRVIHLACISNDPSCALNPALAKSINLDSFPAQVQACEAAGVERFIFASSSSVYGIHEGDSVTEECERIPVSDYNRYKAACEDHLWSTKDFSFTILRPATICGKSPRLRLDLTVNMLTAQAMLNNKITVFGGNQFRPNLHIRDMVDLYVRMIQVPWDNVHRKAFNAGYQNMSVKGIAGLVKNHIDSVYGRSVEIEVTPSNDPRSYRINSTAIRNASGFYAKRFMQDAVLEIADGFERGLLPANALELSQYNNIKRMQEIRLT